MKLGFTGTRNGMTFYQIKFFLAFLRCRTIDELHHGDCLGADCEAHILAHYNKVRFLVVHPPENPKLRAYCDKMFPGEFTEVREEKGYINRNDDIVNETDMLIATPFTPGQTVRSGTWSTIRYARSVGKPVIIIKPNGITVPDIIDVRQAVENVSYW